MSETLRWHFDVFGPRHIGGWADDNGPVALTVFVNGKPVLTGQAGTYREDLERAGIGDGRRSFSFDLSSYLTQAENTVSVCYGGKVLQTSICTPFNEEARFAAIIKASGGTNTNQSSDVRFLQTADPINYRKLLQLTSRTVMEYCGRHNLVYDIHLGICRGSRPWHATFNRIILLRRMLISGYAGWVCYLDADAFVADLDFDVRSYLADKRQFALIVATDQPHVSDRPHWSINAGTFFINLGHPVGQDIVWRWASKLDVLSSEFESFPEWHIDDQSLLGELLRETVSPEHILVLRGDPNLINYSQGLFIRQILRSGFGDNFDKRLALIRSETDRIMKL
jgi:hypothetical protein